MVSVEHLSSYFGLNRGFDKYFNSGKNDWLFHFLCKFRLRVGPYTFRLIAFLRRNGFLDKSEHSCSGEKTNKRVFKWLEGNCDEKFFGWIHYFDSHKPYKPTYETNVKRVDSIFGDLLKKLKELNLLDETVIVITADHGEALGEHGFEGHGRYLYDEEILVPLIFYHPELEPLHVKKQVETIDIMPTILDFSGIKIPQSCMGQSLKPLMLGKQWKREEFAFSESYPPYKEWMKSIRCPEFKFIQNEKSMDELYDLKVDPWEKKNLISEKPETAKWLEEKLRKRLGETEPEEQKINEYTKNVLRGLGYL